jgi:hypothetical protein
LESVPSAEDEKTAPDRRAALRPKRRRRRWPVLLFLALIATAAYWFLSFAARPTAESWLSRTWGARVEVRRVGFDPIGGVLTLEGLVAYLPDGTETLGRPIVARRASIDFQWLPLIHQRLQIREFALEGATLDVERLPEELPDPSRLQSPLSVPTLPPDWSVRVDRLALRDSIVRIRANAGLKKDAEIRVGEARLRAARRRTSILGAARNLELDAFFGGGRFELEGHYSQRAEGLTILADIKASDLPIERLVSLLPGSTGEGLRGRLEADLRYSFGPDRHGFSGLARIRDAALQSEAEAAPELEVRNAILDVEAINLRSRAIRMRSVVLRGFSLRAPEGATAAALDNLSSGRRIRRSTAPGERSWRWSIDRLDASDAQLLFGDPAEPIAVRVDLRGENLGPRSYWSPIRASLDYGNVRASFAGNVRTSYDDPRVEGDLEVKGLDLVTLAREFDLPGGHLLGSGRATANVALYLDRDASGAGFDGTLSLSGVAIEGSTARDPGEVPEEEATESWFGTTASNDEEEAAPWFGNVAPRPSEKKSWFGYEDRRAREEVGPAEADPGLAQASPAPVRPRFDDEETGALRPRFDDEETGAYLASRGGPNPQDDATRFGDPFLTSPKPPVDPLRGRDPEEWTDLFAVGADRIDLRVNAPAPPAAEDEDEEKVRRWWTLDVEMQAPYLHVARAEEGWLFPGAGPEDEETAKDEAAESGDESLPTDPESDGTSSGGESGSTEAPISEEGSTFDWATLPIRFRSLQIRDGRVLLADAAAEPMVTLDVEAIEGQAFEVQFDPLFVGSLLLGGTDAELGRFELRATNATARRGLTIAGEGIPLERSDVYLERLEFPHRFLGGSAAFVAELRHQPESEEVEEGWTVDTLLILSGPMLDETFEAPSRIGEEALPGDDFSLPSAFALLADGSGDVRVRLPRPEDFGAGFDTAVEAAVRGTSLPAAAGGVLAQTAIGFRPGTTALEPEARATLQRIAGDLLRHREFRIEMAAPEALQDERALTERDVLARLEEDRTMLGALSILGLQEDYEGIEVALRARIRGERGDLDDYDQERLAQLMREQPPIARTRLADLGRRRLDALEGLLRRAGVAPSQIVRKPASRRGRTTVAAVLLNLRLPRGDDPMNAGVRRDGP